MRRFGVGMRWWLGGVFVVIAILTAVLISVVASRQIRSDLRSKAQSIAVGTTVSAAFSVQQSVRTRTLKRDLSAIGAQFGLALFVFRGDGSLLAESPLGKTRWPDIPRGRAALATALRDSRFVETFNKGNATVVGLPLHRTTTAHALVAWAPRARVYGAADTIFRHDVIQASLWAVLIAALTGLLAAWLIARRLARIGEAAVAIENGAFDRKLTTRFPDEVGRLAETIDQMRQRLGGAFAQLSAERDRFGRTLEQLREGVIAVDSDLRVQFANANAKDLFRGLQLEGGNRLPERLGSLPLRAVAGRLFADGAAVAEARSEDENGAILSLVGVPAQGSDLVVLVLSDITESERRRRAERDFVNNASHELRTPVTAIASAVEALQHGALEDPASRARFVALIGRQSQRLTRLTSSLLTLARAQMQEERLALEPVVVQPVLHDAAAGANPHAGVSVTVDCDSEVVAIGRRDVLEQIVSNLVGNAAKHTHTGRIVLRGRRNDGQAVIEIADTGSGIPGPIQDRVFDRFFAGGEPNRINGFGLGLAIARESAAAIGGRLWIESEVGVGTTARVVLPAEDR